MKATKKPIILKMGMIGGGPGAFIGDVHRKASRLDGGIVLVAGCFDIKPEKSRQMGRELGLDKGRVYDTYEEMIEAELALPREERIDFVAITTPNNCIQQPDLPCHGPCEAGPAPCRPQLMHSVSRQEANRRHEV